MLSRRVFTRRDLQGVADGNPLPLFGGAMRARFLALTVTLLLMAPAAAEPMKATATDRAAIEACLTLAAGNGGKEAERKETVTETPGAAGRLAEAARLAPTEPESCIGAVANPCQQEPGGYSTAGMIECQSREWAVWDERLNSAYRKALKDSEPKLAQAVTAVQRSWLQWREQKCKLPAIENEGGSIVGPLYTDCMMHTTARQAIWLEAR
jgi:uncharacterized protein YecT (DUF1311 family)